MATSLYLVIWLSGYLVWLLDDLVI